MKKLRTNYARLDGRSSRKAPSFFLLLTVVLIIASLYWAQAVLIPVAVSILLTFLLTPVADSLERLGLGRVFSVILIVILAFSFLAAVGWIVTLELTSVANELPTYRQNMKRKIADIRGAGKGGALEKVQKTAEEMKKELEKKDEPAKVQPKPREVVVQGEQSSTFWPLPLDIAPVFERLASGGLAIVLVIFMLIQREDLRNRLIRLIGYGRLTSTTKAMEEASQRISRYLLMQSIINASFGFSCRHRALVDRASLRPPVGLSGCHVAVHSLRRTLGSRYHAERAERDRFRGMDVARPGCRSLSGVRTRQQYDSGTLALWRERGRFGSRTSYRGCVLDMAMGTYRTDPRHATHGLCRRVEQICPPVGFHQRTDERRAGDEIGHKLLSETIGWGPGRGGGNRRRTSQDPPGRKDL